MIRHVVFFNAKNEEDKDTVFNGLSMLTQIPDALHLEVAKNLQNDSISGNNIEVVVYGEFEDEAQLARYKAHPIYQKSIEIVRPIRELRMAADFIASK